MNGTRFGGLVVAAMLAAAAGIAAAAPAAHEHHGAAAAAAVQRDDGRKWATDAPLRQGMEKIRASVEHDGRAGEYAALAKAIEGQVAYIVENCRLEPAADEALHAVLAQLNDGVAVLNGHKAGVAPADGVAHVVAALDSYGESFDHPGWNPPH